MNYLIVIDMQKDFVSGTLGSGDAKAVVPGLIRKIKEFGGEVLYTQDTHGSAYLLSQEGKKLPVSHCILGTEGWELIDEIKEADPGCRERSFQKDTFGSTELMGYLTKKNQESGISSLEFVGVCTDICVISNALMAKAFLPEVPVLVDSRCCAGTSPENHENALKAMACCQIELK